MVVIRTQRGVMKVVQCVVPGAAQVAKVVAVTICGYPGKIDIFLSGQNLYGEDVSKKLSRMGSGPYSFSVYKGTYKILGQSKGYKSKLIEGIQIDPNTNCSETRDIALQPKEKPSVSIVREDKEYTVNSSVIK